MMKMRLAAGLATAVLLSGALSARLAHANHHEGSEHGSAPHRIQHNLIGSDFPIARAVEVPPGVQLVYHSGMTPRPADPEAERFSPEYWGDTKTQAESVFARMEESLDDLDLSFDDIVKMTVFLVPVPETGRMDFGGFMEAYTQHFGKDAGRMNLPARSAVGVAQLAAPGMLVEVEAIYARKN